MHSDPADARPAPPRQDIYSKKPAGLRLPAIALIAVGATIAFGTSIWYAYQYGVNQQVAANPPLIKAEEGPTKLKPDDPGGMSVPDRDKLVYERVTDTPPEPRAERLLPPPDEPMAKPDAPPPPPAVTSPSHSAGTETSQDVAAAAPPAPPAPNAEAPDNASTQEELPSATVGTLNAIAPAAAPPTPTAADPKPAEKRTVPSETSEPAKTPDAPKQIAKAPPPKPQAATKAPSKPKPEKVALADAYRVQLASFRSSEAANAAWTKLRKSNISLLRDLTAHVTRVELGQKGTFYRLQAGSFSQQDRARSVCTELKARQVDCLVVQTK